MLILARLLVLGIILYLFIDLFLDDFEDRKNAIHYKIYIFLFIFIFNFIFQILSFLINKNKINIGEIIETSINNSLLAVIAYDVYNDLLYNNYFRSYNHQQKVLILILLIIGFISTIKILELLISSN